MTFASRQVRRGLAQLTPWWEGPSIAGGSIASRSTLRDGSVEHDGLSDRRHSGALRRRELPANHPPWNDQVLVSIERPGGRGKDYVTASDQREWTVLTERDGQFSGYAKGVRETISLYEVALERGLKERPTPGDVTAEFGAAKPAAKR